MLIEKRTKYIDKIFWYNLKKKITIFHVHNYTNGTTKNLTVKGGYVFFINCCQILS